MLAAPRTARHTAPPQKARHFPGGVLLYLQIVSPSTFPGRTQRGVCGFVLLAWSSRTPRPPSPRLIPEPIGWQKARHGGRPDRAVEVWRKPRVPDPLLRA